KGIFVEVGCKRFALTPTSQLLTSDHPLSLQEAFPLIRDDLRAWARIDHSLRTGEAAFPLVHGRRYWSYMEDHAEASRRVNRAVEPVRSGEVARLELFCTSGWGRPNCGSVRNLISPVRISVGECRADH